MWDCKYPPQGGDLQSHMARISWFSAGEASSGPKFKGTCEIAESRNVHPSIWLVSAMVTDMWHMITAVHTCHMTVSMARTNQKSEKLVWKEWSSPLKAGLGLIPSRLKRALDSFQPAFFFRSTEHVKNVQNREKTTSKIRKGRYHKLLSHRMSKIGQRMAKTGKGRNQTGVWKGQRTTKINNWQEHKGFKVHVWTTIQTSGGAWSAIPDQARLALGR